MHVTSARIADGSSNRIPKATKRLATILQDVFEVMRNAFKKEVEGETKRPEDLFL